MAHAQKAEEALRREQSRIQAQPKADGAVAPAVAPHAQHHFDQAQRTVSDVRDAIIRQKAEIAEHAVQTATLARRNLAEARGPAASGSPPSAGENGLSALGFSLLGGLATASAANERFRIGERLLGSMRAHFSGSPVVQNSLDVLVSDRDSLLVGLAAGLGITGALISCCHEPVDDSAIAPGDMFRLRRIGEDDDLPEDHPYVKLLPRPSFLARLFGADSGPPPPSTAVPTEPVVAGAMFKMGQDGSSSPYSPRK